MDKERFTPRRLLVIGSLGIFTLATSGCIDNSKNYPNNMSGNHMMQEPRPPYNYIHPDMDNRGHMRKNH